MLYVHEGKSFRGIAREVGIHRETVSKYVHEYEQKRKNFARTRQLPKY
ncbi:helix-turn-helix domain-containing protein [Numidum massiliense]|nr:helix-turn-helix domain-containing protein [Numidum massiliense]